MDQAHDRNSPGSQRADHGRLNPREWLRSLPNQLTLARIAAIPLLFILYPLGVYFEIWGLNVLSALIFTAAAVTDYLDGYLARKYESVTPLGALLDPIADKMLVASALIVLVYAHVVPPVLAGLLICRDIAVSGLRLMALEQQHTIAVSEFGKWKTALQLTGIICLILDRDVFGWPVRTVGMSALWIAAALAFYSAWTYGKAFWDKSKEA